MPSLRLLLFLCVPLLFISCQYAPPVGYAESAPIVQKRDDLNSKLVQLLPAGQQAQKAAQDEARWLADTAYKASASIARQYEPCLPGWLNNRLVNSNHNWQERGLCWQYEHDLFRELRRRRLDYFRIGCSVRDQGEGSEHNCVFVAAKEAVWPQAIVLDPWRYNGRLKIIPPRKVAKQEWQEDLPSTRFLERVYAECHQYPIEHWARVKTGKKWNSYANSWMPEGTSSRQGMLMQYRMHKGLQERGGKLTDY